MGGSGGRGFNDLICIKWGQDILTYLTLTLLGVET